MRARVIIVSLVVLCIFNSCQKEFEDPNDPTANVTADFRAKINGVQFTANRSAATIVNSVISLTGTSADGQIIAFTVADSGIHVYSLDITSISNIGAYVTAGALNYTTNQGATPAESGGNLAIVSVDATNRLISGTFNFKAFSQQDNTQKTVTEGVFNNIPY